VRLSTVLVFVPLAVVAVAIAVANREPVLLRLDPFSDAHPALALAVPLYLLLFLTFLSGILLGALIVGLRRISLRDRKSPRNPPEKPPGKPPGKALVALDAKRLRGDSLSP
jgi:hypothetical protein